MTRFVAAAVESRGGDQGTALVDDCLARLGALPRGANLGFLYATDALAPVLPQVVERLVAGSGVRHWCGAVGAGICGTGVELYDAPALAVMIGAFPDDSFRLVPPSLTDVEHLRAAQAQWLARDPIHFGVVHADPATPATPKLLEGLATGVPGAFLVGGLGVGDGAGAHVADRVAAGGMSGVMFSSAVPVVTGHTQGCTPIAASHEVTRCERNIVIELDHRPALDVLKADVGDILARDLARLGGYIFAALPIAGTDTGDYLVRNLVGIDPQQGLIAVGAILAEGDSLMFCRRDGASAREDLERMLADVAGRAGGAPRGALYHSCLARGRHQFGPGSAELCMVREVLGDLPLVGFFANGEIFHNRLYAYTGVLTVFC